MTTRQRYTLSSRARERSEFSPIDDNSRVMRCRMVREGSVKVEKKRKSLTKRSHRKLRTTVGKRANPVLKDGHPEEEDVAHPATAAVTESDGEMELDSDTARKQAIPLEPPLGGMDTESGDREPLVYTSGRPGSDSGDSRRLIGWSRTLPDDEAASRVRPTQIGTMSDEGLDDLERRTSQTGTRSGVLALSCYRTRKGPEDTEDESDEIPDSEHENLDHKGARPKLRKRKSKRRLLSETGVPGEASTFETFAGTRSGRERGFHEDNGWLITVPKTTEVVQNDVNNETFTHRRETVGESRFDRSRPLDDNRVPRIIRERTIDDRSGNLVQVRAPSTVQGRQTVQLRQADDRPSEFETGKKTSGDIVAHQRHEGERVSFTSTQEGRSRPVTDEVDWQAEMSYLRQSVAMMSSRLEELSIPAAQHKESYQRETSGKPTGPGCQVDRRGKLQIEELARSRGNAETREEVSHSETTERLRNRCLPEDSGGISHGETSRQVSRRRLLARGRAEAKLLSDSETDSVDPEEVTGTRVFDRKTKRKTYGKDRLPECERHDRQTDRDQLAWKETHERYSKGQKPDSRSRNCLRYDESDRPPESSKRDTCEKDRRVTFVSGNSQSSRNKSKRQDYKVYAGGEPRRKGQRQAEYNSDEESATSGDREMTTMSSKWRTGKTLGTLRGQSRHRSVVRTDEENDSMSDDEDNRRGNPKKSVGRSLVTRTRGEDRSDRGIRIKLEKYDGKSAIAAFLAKFEVCARCNRWSDQEKADQLMCALTGPASQLLWDMGAQRDVSWRVLVERLKARYGSDDQTSLYRTKLRTYRQAHGETLSSVVQEIRRLMALAYPGPTSEIVETVACDAFIDALANQDLGQKVREREPDNLEAAYKHAVRLDAYGRSSTQGGDLDRRHGSVD